MLPGLVIPAKAGIQMFVNYTDMDTGFRQYDALLAFWDRLKNPPLHLRICFICCECFCFYPLFIPFIPVKCFAFNLPT